MPSVDLRKIYSFHPVEPAPDSSNLPVGCDFYYECLDCATVLSSTPYIACGCECGNVTGASGKAAVAKPERVRVVKGKLK